MRSDLDRILDEEAADALILYSESIKNSNMFYMTRFLAPDRLLLLKKKNEPPTLIVNSMELLRAQKECIIKDVRSSRTTIV